MNNLLQETQIITAKTTFLLVEERVGPQGPPEVEVAASVFVPEVTPPSSRGRDYEGTPNTPHPDA